MTDTRVSEYVSRQQNGGAKHRAAADDKGSIFPHACDRTVSLGAIWQREERLARFVGEHCRRTHPQIVTIHRELVTDQHTSKFLKSPTNGSRYCGA